MRRVLIVGHEFPPTSEDITQAAALGAGEVICGVPPSMEGLGVGYHEIEEPILAAQVATVDMRQASLMLASQPHNGASRLDAVDAYVATQARQVRIEWERARELRRDHPMVAIMGFFFGLTAGDLDQWFAEAGAIGPTLTQ